MANFIEQMESNVSSNKALLLHVQTRFEKTEADALSSAELDRVKQMHKEVEKFKAGSVTMDFGAESSKDDIVKACEEITERCQNNPDSNHVINLENVFGDGMSNHKELVDNLIKNRTLPTGAKLPDNAVMLMTLSDAQLEDDKVADNFAKYNGEVQAACGGFVDIPRVPSDKELSDMAKTFDGIQKQKDAVMEQ